MGNNCVDIDVGKLTFFAAIKVADKDKVKSFSNDEDGFNKFHEWYVLIGDHFNQLHFCMESTGKYGLALASFLHHKGGRVSIVNPAKIKFFMKSQLTRNKTDSVDSKSIRRYCELFSPPIWQPLKPEVQDLQTLVKRLDTLSKIMLQEQNRLENLDALIRSSIDNHILYLKGEISSTEKLIHN